MLEIDSIAYNSRIYNVSPVLKIAVGLLPLIICVYFNEIYVSLITIFFMSSFTVYASQIKISEYIKILCIPMVFIIIGSVTIIISNVSKVSDSFTFIIIFGESYGISTESFFMGILLILRSFGAISCMYFISLNTTIMDIGHALQKAKVPAIIISLIVLVYRYIFVIFEEVYKMKVAKNSRGGTKANGIFDSLNSLGNLLGVLFIRCLVRCDKIYMALVSRGFNGNLKMITPKYNNTYNKKLVLLLITCLLLQIFLGLTK